MPCIVPHKVGVSVGNGYRLSERCWVINRDRSIHWLCWIQWADVVRNHKWKTHMLWTHCHDGVHQRVHLDRFLPTKLIGLRPGHCTIPTNTVDQLDVKEVEVHHV